MVGNIWKKIIIAVISVLTIGLIAGYLYWAKNDSNGKMAFVISMLYACFIFFITIPYNKIESYTQERVYERKAYYYSLSTIRAVMNSTVRNASVEDIENFRSSIVWFQLLTGREDETNRKRIEGEDIPIYAKENGFRYQDKMKKLENDFFQSINENNK